MHLIEGTRGSADDRRALPSDSLGGIYHSASTVAQARHRIRVFASRHRKASQRADSLKPFEVLEARLDVRSRSQALMASRSVGRASPVAMGVSRRRCSQRAVRAVCVHLLRD
jgi:hypothetical protein